MSAQQMVKCGGCAHFVRDGKCRFFDTPAGKAKDRPFAFAPFWVWSDCYSDKEQVRATTESACAAYSAKAAASIEAAR